MKTKRLFQALSALLITVATSALGGTFTANYLGGGTWEQEPGAWSTTAWPRNHFYYLDSSGNQIPDGDPLYNVVINNATPCTLSREITIESLNVAPGSTLNLADSGALIMATGPITNGGTINLTGRSNRLTGVLVHSGILNLNSPGANDLHGTRLGNGSVFKTGSQVVLGPSGQNYISSSGNGNSLTIESGASVKGSGAINDGFLGFDLNVTNQGLIEATNPAAILLINLSQDTGAILTNTGTLRANGGVLAIRRSPGSSGSDIFNNGGTIAALNSSTVDLGARVKVTGGTLVTSGSGVIEGSGVLAGVTNNGTVVVRQNQNLYLSGLFTNNGTLLVNGVTTGRAFLHVVDGTTIAGPGVVQLTCADNGNGADITGGANGTNALTIAPGATVQGCGAINDDGFFGEGAVRTTNQGLIHANEPNLALNIQSNAFNNTAFTNSGGTLRASDGGIVVFVGSSTVTNNGGTFQASANSKISGQGGIILMQSAGTLDLDGGTMEFPAGVDLNGGQLIGNGTFNGPIRNNGGIVAPGHSAGKITVNGNYTQGANGVLNMEIGGTAPGTEYDQLRVNGTATLGGTLNVSLINGYRPAVGTIFQIIAPNAFAGSFATINTNGFTGTVNFSNNSITLTVTSVPYIPLNISTRLNVESDPNQLIGGFTITGTEPKKVIILATGPSLDKFNLTGLLADPILELYQGGTLIASNDNWEVPDKAAIEATGFQPGHKLESALLRTLPPGAYTAVVRGTNGTGLGTVQLYDLAETTKSKLANIAARGVVETPDNKILIGGFIIGGNGGGDCRVIVRALGPSLSGFQIGTVLPDPTLEVKNANGSTLAFNDDWQQSPQAAEIQARGFAPADKESALLISLPNGAFTAVVRGKDGKTGVAVVEVYNVD